MTKVNVIVHPISNFTNNKVVKHIDRKLWCSFEIPKEIIAKGTVLYLPFDNLKERAFEIRQIHYSVSSGAFDLNCGYCLEGFIDDGINSKTSVAEMVQSALNNGWAIHSTSEDSNGLRSVG